MWHNCQLDHPKSGCQKCSHTYIKQEIISLYLSVVDLCRVLSCNVIPRPVLIVRESLVMGGTWAGHGSPLQVAQSRTSGHHPPPPPPLSLNDPHALGEGKRRHNYESLASTNGSYDVRSSVGAPPPDTPTSVCTLK